MPLAMSDVATLLAAAVERLLPTPRLRPLVLGLAGPQGAGKSTVTAGLQAQLATRGRRLAALSLDDFYLSQAERMALARQVHPLFATRGPPGTHDVQACREVLAALAAGAPTLVWRFDKARDERAPREAWRKLEGPFDVVLLEGWCVGARPQPTEALARPVNALEALEDPQAHWRLAVNQALAGPYQQLFAELDGFFLLGAPDWATVRRWRGEQEQDIAPAERLSEAALDRFCAHFERLTRWMREEAPARAELFVPLDAQRRPA